MTCDANVLKDPSRQLDDQANLCCANILFQTPGVEKLRLCTTTDRVSAC